MTWCNQNFDCLLAWQSDFRNEITVPLPEYNLDLHLNISVRKRARVCMEGLTLTCTDVLFWDYDTVRDLFRRIPQNVPEKYRVMLFTSHQQEMWTDDELAIRPQYVCNQYNLLCLLYYFICIPLCKVKTNDGSMHTFTVIFQF